MAPVGPGEEVLPGVAQLVPHARVHRVHLLDDGVVGGVVSLGSVR